MSVSVSGCGSKDESSVAASEHTDSESEEQETSENIPDNQDNNQKSEKKETENSEVDGKLPEKHVQKKRKTSEEIFDILYGCWISDNNEEKLIFSAGVGDISYKAELITNVSHDIKTPLTAIVNYVDLLKRENLENDKARSYIRILDEKSQRLKQLTEDLVEASKISSGNIHLDMQNIDMVELTLVEDNVSRKELLELIRQHYLHTGSALAGRMLDDWNRYVGDFIQVTPIEYKRVLQEEQMAKLREKIDAVSRDY